MEHCDVHLGILASQKGPGVTSVRLFKLAIFRENVGHAFTPSRPWIATLAYASVPLRRPSVPGSAAICDRSCCVLRFALLPAFCATPYATRHTSYATHGAIQLLYTRFPVPYGGKLADIEKRPAASIIANKSTQLNTERVDEESPTLSANTTPINQACIKSLEENIYLCRL